MRISELFARANVASLVRFALGGVLSSGIAIGSTAFLHELLSVREPVAAAAGFVLAMSVNFFVLRTFVFRGTQQPLGRQVLVFIGSSGVFRALEYGAFFLLNVLLHVQYLIALVLVLAASFLLKFTIFNGFIFRRSNVTQIENGTRGGKVS